jgi:hypothetical protein
MVLPKGIEPLFSSFVGSNPKLPSAEVNIVDDRGVEPQSDFKTHGQLPMTDYRVVQIVVLLVCYFMLIQHFF